MVEVSIIWPVCHKKVVEVLQGYDIFVIPSIFFACDANGMPVSVMEAMAVGLPVILALMSGIPVLV